MEGFGLLLGHLLGDYVVQNDWMSRWKVARPRTTTPAEDLETQSYHGDRRHLHLNSMEGWWAWRPWWACTLHCLCYALAVWACAWWWLPWWGPPVCFLAHWPVDRYRLARWWMVNVAGQKDFATGALAPWSIIVVDNVFHLLTLFVIGLVALAPWSGR